MYLILIGSMWLAGSAYFASLSCLANSLTLQTKIIEILCIISKTLFRLTGLRITQLIPSVLIMCHWGNVESVSGSLKFNIYYSFLHDRLFFNLKNVFGMQLSLVMGALLNYGGMVLCYVFSGLSASFLCSWASPTSSRCAT